MCSGCRNDDLTPAQLSGFADSSLKLAPIFALRTPEKRRSYRTRCKFAEIVSRAFSAGFRFVLGRARTLWARGTRPEMKHRAIPFWNARTLPRRDAARGRALARAEAASEALRASRVAGEGRLVAFAARATKIPRHRMLLPATFRSRNDRTVASTAVPTSRATKWWSALFLRKRAGEFGAHADWEALPGGVECFSVPDEVWVGRDEIVEVYGKGFRRRQGSSGSTK